MKGSVVLRLWLSISLLSVAGLLVMGVVVPRQMESIYDSHLSALLLEQARGLVVQYSPDPHNPGTRPWKSQERVIGAQIDTLTAGELATMADTDLCPAPVYLPPHAANRVLAGEAVYFRATHAQRFPEEQGNRIAALAPEYFIVAVPLYSHNVVNGALVLTQPVTAVLETISQFRRLLGVTALVMLGGVSLIALYLSGRLALPLRKMEGMARAMAAGNFQQRVAVIGNDEVARLGRSINRLADELDSTIAQLRERNARLSGILCSMSDAVMLAEAGGHFALLNRPAAVLLEEAGLKPAGEDEPLDWGVLESLGVADQVRQVLHEGTSRAERVSLGEKIYTVYFSPVPGVHGEDQVDGVVMVWQDITQGERLEEMRRAFVANVSHELRTPIGLVRGYAEALLDGLAESPEEREEALRIMQHELDRMAALVQDLLQLARMDAGQLPVDLTPVNLRHQISHVLKRVSRMAREAGVDIETAMPHGLPIVMADADRLEQVLLNLLDNALQYSPEGGRVTIGAHRQGGWVTVFVEDQGPGIPVKERSLVWERFYRRDPAHSRKKGGTGLGLAIVRGIVAAHGGETWVEDGTNGGSRFCFTLPVA